jgi:WD40 repeat protein
MGRKDGKVSHLKKKSRVVLTVARFVATLRGHVGAVYRLAWSADSRQLISASKDSTLKVYYYTLVPLLR